MTFTPEQRVKVANVLTRVMDEMDDSGELESMYEPFQRVVIQALEIADVLGDEESIMIGPNELMQIWARDRSVEPVHSRPDMIP